MSICRITGKIIDSREHPLDGCRIYAIPEIAPSIISTSSGNEALSVLPRWTITELDGTFYLDLVRNINFNIIIKEIGLVQTVRIPDLATVDIYTLLGVQPVIETSTGDTW